MAFRRYKLLLPLLLALAVLVLAGCGGKETPVAPATRAPEAATGPGGATQPAAQTTGKLEGVVVDAGTGQPLEQVVVKTSPDSPGATTNAEGKFEIADLPIGVYSVEASLPGYGVGFEGNLAIVAGGAQSLELKLEPAEEYPLADVRSIFASEGEIYPDEKVWITLHGGYAYHDNEKIVTTGLDNVGVGTYVYLAGREQDGHGEEISGWTWKVIGPGEQEVAVENANTRTPRFLAAKEGKYEVIVEADVAGEKHTSELTVNAGRYVGVENCASCHNGSVRPDVYSSWLATGHGTKLETTYASYGAERDYCIGCHVTGYNETANDGGLDDMAVRSGWNPAEGSLVGWLVEGEKTVDQIKASPMGKLINVQCESCHGPGSVHTGTSSYDPGVCEQCHTQGAQWTSSGHANTGWKNSHTAESASCVPCHTGEGYVVATIRGERPVFPSNATPLRPANPAPPGEQAPVACAACHDPHQATEPGEGGKSAQLRQHGGVTIGAGVTIEAGEAATCVSCHANKRDAKYKEDYLAGKKVRGPHENGQVDVLFGVKESVFDMGASFSSSPHADLVENGCITCHMAPNLLLDAGADGEAGTRDDVRAPNIGGHSFSMAAEVEGKGRLENVASCEGSGCHAEGSIETFDREARGDYDGDGKVEGVQDEVTGLLELLAAKLPKDDSGAILSSTISADNTTEVERQALWNYWLIAGDGSNGIHNTGFTVQVLQKTYEQLAGEPVPNATIR